MQIEFQPMPDYLTYKSAGVVAAVLLIAIALYAGLKRDGKTVQAVAAPLVLLAVFSGVLHYEAHKAYSLRTMGQNLVLETPFGTRSTACSNIEFMIRQGRGGCTVTGFRGDERVFQSVEVQRPQCQALAEQLRQVPCKPSDRPDHITGSN
ncbi:hypothetical protein [Aquabacterium parvum]|jgi:hypothetical protein|uniref:hypothetical protein n=1 Tax=Aquabacterium parvum TaxID=70584 RepID=UPI00128FC625|nr:hypothetical protein [Aquabacterium parvum]